MNTQKIYSDMKSENDFTQIIKTCLNECGVKNKKLAYNLLDAFLQWFALIPMLKQNEKLQMIREIDPIWHAMILNTKFYREFCNKYVGHYVDHDPTDVGIEEGKEEYARFTLKLLEQEYPTNINKYLYFLEQGATCCVGSGACGDIDSDGDAFANSNKEYSLVLH